MKAAYRIVDWKKLYEVTDKGKPAKEDTPEDKLRNSPLPYARYADNGWLISPEFKQMCKLAWSIGPLMELACYGLYKKLVDISRAQEKEYRGWLLDPKHRPVNAYQFADMMDIKDQSYINKLFDILAHPTVGLIELVQYPAGIPLDSPSQVEEGGGLLDSMWNFEGPFKIVTEAEYKEKFKRNDSPAPGEFEDTPCPSSDSGSARATDSSAAVSDFDPSRGRGYLISDIPQLKAKFLLELSDLIRPRTSSDITTFQDIARQLEGRMTTETELDLFGLAIEKARNCYRATKPIAMFVAAMKKEPFNYNPKGTSVIRGRKDRYKHYD